MDTIDQAGNISASCNQTVIVTDNENQSSHLALETKPILVLTELGLYYNSKSRFSTTPIIAFVSITAKIGSIIDPATHLFVIGTTTVTWVATDDNSGLRLLLVIKIIGIIENPTISCLVIKMFFFLIHGFGFTLLDYTTLLPHPLNCDNTFSKSSSRYNNYRNNCNINR
jgi:hypothetical protein